MLHQLNLWWCHRPWMTCVAWTWYLNPRSSSLHWRPAAVLTTLPLRFASSRQSRKSVAASRRKSTPTFSRYYEYHSHILFSTNIISLSFLLSVVWVKLPIYYLLYIIFTEVTLTMGFMNDCGHIQNKFLANVANNTQPWKKLFHLNQQHSHRQPNRTLPYHTVELVGFITKMLDIGLVG